MKALLLLLTLLALILPAAAGPAEDARRLKDAHEKEIHRARLAYVQQLDALLAKAKASGDPAAVKAIEAMIAEVEGGPSESSDPLATLVGTWQQQDDGRVWRFNSTKDGNVSGKYPFTMTFDQQARRVTLIGRDWVNFIEFTGSPNELAGSYEKNGRTARFKLKRVK